MLDIITAEESVFAQQCAREDYIASNSTQIINEEVIVTSGAYQSNDIPLCMDFDRFAHTLRS